MATLNKFLRFLFVGVAAADVVIGFLILLVSDLLARSIGLNPPEPFYIWVLGLLQIGLALAYLVSSGDPARYINHVALAGGMRLAMAILLIVAGYKMKLPFLIVLGSLEIAVGLSHSLYATRLARNIVSRH
jgi:hypothetical protein